MCSDIQVPSSCTPHAADLPVAVVDCESNRAMTGVIALFVSRGCRFCGAARSVLHTAEPQHPGFLDLALRHRYPLRHLHTGTLPCDELGSYLAQVGAAVADMDTSPHQAAASASLSAAWLMDAMPAECAQCQNSMLQLQGQKLQKYSRWRTRRRPAAWWRWTSPGVHWRGAHRRWCAPPQRTPGPSWPACSRASAACALSPAMYARPVLA
jgi:hypothetical protein